MRIAFNTIYKIFYHRKCLASLTCFCCCHIISYFFVFYTPLQFSLRHTLVHYNSVTFLALLHFFIPFSLAFLLPQTLYFSYMSWAIELQTPL